MIQLFITYKRLSKTEKRMFWHACRLSVLFMIIVHLLPYKLYKRFLGKPLNSDEFLEIEPSRVKTVEIIHRSVKRSGKYLPWPHKCLINAIVAKRLLNKQNIPSVLCLGVAKTPGEGLKAHAWVKCGTIVVTGKRGMEKYKAVSWFK
jgi:hypothetical protein